jgi:hypothetical protein
MNPTDEKKRPSSLTRNISDPNPKPKMSSELIEEEEVPATKKLSKLERLRQRFQSVDQTTKVDRKNPPKMSVSFV